MELDKGRDPQRDRESSGRSWGNPFPLPFSQVPPHPSGPPVVGALQPPAFTAPLGIPPPGFAPGVPPPPPPPFLRPGFNPLHLPPGLWGCASPGSAGPRAAPAARGAVPRGHSGLSCAFCRIPSSRATTSHNSSGLCPAHSGSEHPKL